MVIFLNFTPKNELHEKFENSLQTSLERNFVHLIYIYISGHVARWKKKNNMYIFIGLYYNSKTILQIWAYITIDSRLDLLKKKEKKKKRKTNKQTKKINHGKWRE